MKKTVISAIIALVLLGCSNSDGPSVSSKRFQTVDKDQAVILQHGKNSTSCSICGMDLVKFYKTNHAATYEGDTKQYCSIHCMVDDLNKGHTLKNPKVVNLKTLKFTDASKAYYVVGSSQPPTMSRVSKYAFKDKKDAEEFVKLYGGEIKDMYGAIDIAQKDFR
jgi:nitrous oxide reductase accessory protein NosL